MRRDQKCAIFGPMAQNDLASDRDEDIAARLVLLRDARGWNQAEFARRLNITPQRLSNWESGTGQRIPLAGAHVVRRVTGATLDWIYYGIEDGLPSGLADLIHTSRQERPANASGRARRPRKKAVR